MKHWYYFLIADYGNKRARWSSNKPEYLSDPELFQLVVRTKAENLGMSIFPFVYSYQSGTWVWDPRNDRQILAGEMIPGYVA